MAIYLTLRTLLKPNGYVAPSSVNLKLPRLRNCDTTIQYYVPKQRRLIPIKRGVCYCANEDSKQDLYFEEMSVQQLSTLLTNAEEAIDVQFVDVREPWEVELVSLPLFKTYPLKELLDGDIEGLQQDKKTILLCHHGMRSRTASAHLKLEGFKKVYNVTGGIDAYASTVDPSIGTY